MFYVEVQLDTAGQLVDVKVAHHGENPAVSTTERDEINVVVRVFEICVFHVSLGNFPPMVCKTMLSFGLVALLVSVLYSFFDINVLYYFAQSHLAFYPNDM